MMQLPDSLWRLAGQNALGEADLAFADLVGRMQGTLSEPLLLAAALAFAAQEAGHSCFDLPAYAETVFPRTADDGAGDEGLPQFSITLPALEPWLVALKNAPAVVASAHAEVTLPRPLVLDSCGRLYLHRFYQQEWQVASTIRERALQPVALPREMVGTLGSLLDEAFGPHAPWQQFACFLALTRNFMVLSGGPGTGKTHTMARLAAILLTADPHLRIRLAAPTGKAANRMMESIRDAKRSLPACLGAGRHIPDHAETLHRLLSASADGSSFRRNRENPIEGDVVIVDEASMIALPMMATLLDALPANCRLILLGDMDQLASVDPGAVLGDICRAAGAGHVFSSAVRSAYREATGRDALLPDISWTGQPGLGDCLVTLTQSRRFSPAHPVAVIGRAVRDASDEVGAREAFHVYSSLAANPESGMHWHAVTGASLLDAGQQPLAALRECIWNGYLALLNADSPEAALAALKRFRILCAVRKGPFGVDALNRLAERILSRDGSSITGGMARERGAMHILSCRQNGYARQPIMITRNDYVQRLFNGDVGVVMDDVDGRRAAWFETLDQDGNTILRNVSLGQLPPWETAFASTIHKAQGSEFANLAVILPPVPGELVTKELLYTALTRVKPDAAHPHTTGQIHIWSSEDAFCHAALHATRRASGLVDALTEKNG